MASTQGTWIPTNSVAIGMQPIATVDTTQNHPFGTRVRARDIGSTNYGEAEFVYVKGVASGAVAKLASYITKSGLTTLTVGDTNGSLGAFVSTLDATIKFGWLQIYGRAIVKCLTAFADAGVCYLTSTGGSVDDASVIGDVIHNMMGRNGGTVTIGDLAGEFQLNYPYSENRVSLSN